MNTRELFRKEIQRSGIGGKFETYAWVIEVSGDRGREWPNQYSSLGAAGNSVFRTEEEAEADMELFVGWCKEKGVILSEDPHLQTIRPAGLH